MDNQILIGIKIILLIYTINSIGYGLLHLISPELVGVKDPTIERVFVAAVLALVFGTGLAYRENNWCNFGHTFDKSIYARVEKRQFNHFQIKK